MNIQVGQPLHFYRRGEAEWPQVWRMPDLAGEDGTVFAKTCALSDDLVLRAAVNIYDNCLRHADAFEGACAGLIAAHARLMAGAGLKVTPEQAADAVRTAWLRMFQQAVDIQAHGWGE